MHVDTIQHAPHAPHACAGAGVQVGWLAWVVVCVCGQWWEEHAQQANTVPSPLATKDKTNSNNQNSAPTTHAPATLSRRPVVEGGGQQETGPAAEVVDAGPQPTRVAHFTQQAQGGAAPHVEQGGDLRHAQGLGSGHQRIRHLSELGEVPESGRGEGAGHGR